MKKNAALFTKALTGLVTLALFATGCTKTRDAALPDSEVVSVFAISDFGTVSDNAGFKVSAKQSLKTTSSNASANKATDEKGFVSIDPDDTDLPARMRFMFNNLEITGQEGQNFKIVFGVDSKFVTAYKVTSDLSSLSKLEKQIAVTATEVQTAIELQKTTGSRATTALSQKIASAQKARISSIAKQLDTVLYVPLFKYAIVAKGVLERTRNEVRESTSVLTLRETEFAQATHIKISPNSDSRLDVGSVDQLREMEQLYTMDSLDNKTTTSGDLQSRYNVNMKFIKEGDKVFTKLDSKDLKVYEFTTASALNEDELRQLKTGNANGELLRCVDQAADQMGASAQDKNCVLRLAATLPVKYKNATLKLADKNSNVGNTIEFLEVTKNQANGLVEIARETPALRQLNKGLIDPLKTIKISDLKGDFYFRRTFEDASNMMTVGKAGTSGDMAIINFELAKDRIVIRNQRALIQYAGQTAKDREELMSVPVKYFKLEKVDANGVALVSANVVETTKEDAEYLEIDWTANKIPVANSPLAYYSTGRCLTTQSSQNVTDMDMRLEKDGVLNFSLAGSYSVDPQCANQVSTNDAYFSMNAQFNYNVIERLSFKKKTDPSQDVQFASGISPAAQNSMNFAIFTIGEKKTGSDVRDNRVNSEAYKPVIHDFRNGKVLKYWIGGLQNAPAERRELITKATQEVIAEWNEAFRRAFKGSDLERATDYVQLMTEDESHRGHLGDLDRNYLWFMDMPAENGLLGVAQPAPNPNSGIIVANNVIVYSGNSEKEVRGFVNSYTESRTYEKMLEEAKRVAIEEMKKQQAEEAAAAAAAPSSSKPGMDVVNRIQGQSNQLGSYLKRLVLSTRPTTMPRMSSMYGSYVAKNSKPKMALNGKNLLRRNVVSDAQITSDKSFTRNVMQQLLASDFKNDPLMLEAIIAKEMSRTEPGMSAETKALLQQQAAAKIASLKFDQAAKKQGGCFLYTSEYYNDKFLATGFDDLFKKEIKATLSHEIGHALGLVHNFKGSYDRENFNFEGENTDRNYTSIMDYLASTEMGYHGPGPYDVHALRAIYTNRVELSDRVKAIAAKSGGQLKGANFTAKVLDGKYVSINEVGRLLDFASEADMQKLTIDKSDVLKHYGQCNDGQVGEEPGCMSYDSGSSATEVVQNAIRGYNRSYIVSYHAADRLNFGWEQKISVITRSIQTFRTIRATLDTFFQMAIYGTALNNEELMNYKEASHMGYDFFHSLIRTPDTDLPYGSTAEEIAKRLLVVSYTNSVPRMTKDANGNAVAVLDKDQKPVVDEVPDVKVLEARRVYDAAPTPTRLDTIGIGYDKAFALEFLMTANPKAGSDDSQVGWISFNEFEQYILGIQNAAQSTNMLTMLEIMTGDLAAGFVDANHNLRTLGQPVTINRMMLDGAALDSILYPNQAKMMGLDTFAEFFKMGTLKAGLGIKDRLMVARYGQSSTSDAAIKFYAPDNATGSDVLVSKAARKSVYLENKAELAQLISTMVNADVQLSARAAALKEASADKNAKVEALVAADADAQKLILAGEEAAKKLTARLNELNKKDVLVTKEEIKSNANLALETQVKILRGMLASTQTFLGQASALLSSVPEDQLEKTIAQVVDILSKRKANNDQLATLDLLAFGQEILGESVEDAGITLQNGKQISTAAVLGVMMSKGKLTADLQSLMYSIEALSRYTRQLAPEYMN